MSTLQYQTRDGTRTIERDEIHYNSERGFVVGFNANGEDKIKVPIQRVVIVHE